VVIGDKTKGSNSSKTDLAAEYENKSRSYLQQDDNIEMAVIINMKDVAVYSRNTNMKVDDLSFSIFQIRRDWNDQALINKNPNLSRFFNFINKFKRQDLTSDQKLERIINAPPHDEKYTPLHKQIENDKILRSVKNVVESLKSDIAMQGLNTIQLSVSYNELRKKVYRRRDKPHY
jgi:hypothetical protein